MRSVYKQKGFTIVELLIVIVIIGILAALVIVAYNGIQTRARNTQVASSIQVYRKALLQYAVENQSYPSTGRACLGQDYPDTGVFTAANNRQCFRSNSTATIDTNFNNALKPYLGNATQLPMTNNTIFGAGVSPGWTTRGALFIGNLGITIDGVANPWAIIYTVEGQTQCPVGPVMNLSTYPSVSSSTPPSQGYSQLMSGGTVGVECWLALPDPTKV